MGLGPWLLILFIGTGIFLTVRLKFLPWRNLGFALRQVVLDIIHPGGAARGGYFALSVVNDCHGGNDGYGEYCRCCYGNGAWRSGRSCMDDAFRVDMHVGKPC